MAKSDKELKPLLDKSSTHHHHQQTQQHSSSTQKKHTVKGKTSSKPKLFSVSETSVESTEPSVKEERHGRECNEKDVDELETQKMKQKKSTQSTLSPHPPQQLQTCTGEYLEDGKQPAQTFGVKSYLHHFYESVSQSQTPSQVSYFSWSYFRNLKKACKLHSSRKFNQFPLESRIINLSIVEIKPNITRSSEKVGQVHKPNIETIIVCNVDMYI